MDDDAAIWVMRKGQYLDEIVSRAELWAAIERHRWQMWDWGQDVGLAQHGVPKPQAVRETEEALRELLGMDAPA